MSQPSPTGERIGSDVVDTRLPAWVLGYQPEQRGCRGRGGVLSTCNASGIDPTRYRAAVNGEFAQNIGIIGVRCLPYVLGEEEFSDF